MQYNNKLSCITETAKKTFKSFYHIKPTKTTTPPPKELTRGTGRSSRREEGQTVGELLKNFM
jgi:hypothetical protein